MDVQISITATGVKEVRAKLASLAAAIENPGEKVMKRLAGVCLEDIDQRFATRGYGTWQPLSPRTIKRKGHENVLVDTGAMQSSPRIATLTGNSFSVEVPYGGRRHNPDIPGYHQRGTSRMPQRKIVEVTPRLTAALILETESWLSSMTEAGKQSL